MSRRKKNTFILFCFCLFEIVFAVVVFFLFVVKKIKINLCSTREVLKYSICVIFSTFGDECEGRVNHRTVSKCSNTAVCSFSHNKLFESSSNKNKCIYLYSISIVHIKKASYNVKKSRKKIWHKTMVKKTARYKSIWQFSMIKERWDHSHTTIDWLCCINTEKKQGYRHREVVIKLINGFYVQY